MNRRILMCERQRPVFCIFNKLLDAMIVQFCRHHVRDGVSAWSIAGILWFRGLSTAPVFGISTQFSGHHAPAAALVNHTNASAPLSALIHSSSTMRLNRTL